MNSIFRKSLDDNSKNDDDDDEVDDYMSDSFIDNIASNSTSLLMTRKNRYEHERYKRKIESNPKSKKSIKQLEEQLRDKALSKPIDEQNKGYLLLQKMMCKNNDEKAELHQKTGNQISKLVTEREPIMVDLKSDRRGLGHKFKRELEKTIVQSPEDIETKLKQKQSEFLQHKRQKTSLFYCQKDFLKCQSVCFNLDHDNNIKQPFEEWYWPKELVTKNDKEKVDDLPETDEDQPEEQIDFESRLIELNSYLRNKYNYCLWCGVKYDSLEDINDNCPGDNRDAHDD